MLKWAFRGTHTCRWAGKLKLAVFQGKVRVKGTDSGVEPPGLNPGSITFTACLRQVTQMLFSLVSTYPPLKNGTSNILPHRCGHWRQCLGRL